MRSISLITYSRTGWRESAFAVSNKTARVVVIRPASWSDIAVAVAWCSSCLIINAIQNAVSAKAFRMSGFIASVCRTNNDRVVWKDQRVNPGNPRQRRATLRIEDAQFGRALFAGAMVRQLAIRRVRPEQLPFRRNGPLFCGPPLEVFRQPNQADCANSPDTAGCSIRTAARGRLCRTHPSARSAPYACIPC